MKTFTPTEQARAWLIRNYGTFLITMPMASQRQLIAAYLAGHRSGRNGSKK